jgi:hypothetical protein
MTTFYCLSLEPPPTWKARFPYLYPPGTAWPGYTPRHCCLFVASYVSQGYGGGVRTRFHAGASHFKITHRQGPRRKHNPSIVVEQCLQLRCIATVAARITWKTPFIYCCMRVCCGRYLETAAVYSH